MDATPGRNTRTCAIPRVRVFSAGSEIGERKKRTIRENARTERDRRVEICAVDEFARGSTRSEDLDNDEYTARINVTPPMMYTRLH